MANLILFAALAGAPSALADDGFRAPPTEFYSESTHLHLVRPLIDGPAALEMRMQMIERAKRSIDISTFIFEHDWATREMLQAIKKRVQDPDPAKRIKVRLLIDYAGMSGSPELKPWEVAAIQEAGIEVKFYNSHKNGLAFLRRDHDKLFIIDGGEEFITGGRNMARTYFDPTVPHFYLDYDIWVVGPSGKTAQTTFNAFWKSPLSETPARPKPPVPGSIEATAQAQAKWIMVTNDQDRMFSTRMRTVGGRNLMGSSLVQSYDVTFAGDRPIDQDHDRIVSGTVDRFMAESQKSLCMENICLALRDEQKTIMKNLLNRGIRTQLTINTARAMQLDGIIGRVSRAIDTNYIQALEYQPYVKKLDLRLMDSSHLEVHSKAFVRDHQDVLIGSFNLDPVSKNANAEASVIVKGSPLLAREMEASMNERLQLATRYDINQPSHCNSVPDTYLERIMGSGGKLLTPLLYWMIKDHI